jgi:hypothetical protein
MSCCARLAPPCLLQRVSGTTRARACEVCITCLLFIRPSPPQHVHTASRPHAEHTTTPRDSASETTHTTHRAGCSPVGYLQRHHDGGVDAGTDDTHHAQHLPVCPVGARDASVRACGCVDAGGCRAGVGCAMQPGGSTQLLLLVVVPQCSTTHQELGPPIPLCARGCCCCCSLGRGRTHVPSSSAIHGRKRLHWWG